MDNKHSAQLKLWLCFSQSQVCSTGSKTTQTNVLMSREGGAQHRQNEPEPDLELSQQCGYLMSLHTKVMCSELYLPRIEVVNMNCTIHTAGE